jgi:hypothetical protein
MRNIALWSLNLPAMAFWPFISLFPAFALMNGVASGSAMAVHWLFLLTGFWPMLAGALFAGYAMTDAARAERRAKRKPQGVQVGFYATAWSLAYLAAVVLV